LFLVIGGSIRVCQMRHTGARLQQSRSRSTLLRWTFGAMSSRQSQRRLLHHAGGGQAHEAPAQRSIVVTASVAALKASSLPSYAIHARKRASPSRPGRRARALDPMTSGSTRSRRPFATTSERPDEDPGRAAMFAKTLPMARVRAEGIKGLACCGYACIELHHGAVIPIDGGTQA